MRSKRFLVSIVAAAVAVAVGAWWLTRQGRDTGELVVYGNVDLRQVELPFNNTERIDAVLVQEGDRVKKGQLLARLETTRLEPQVAQAEAQVAAQRQVVTRLKNGSRPEEIDQARANLEAAKAEAARSRSQYERSRAAASEGAISQQDLENAKNALQAADAKVVVSRKTLELSLLGPRIEEIDEAEARLHAAEAELAFLRKQLADTKLFAPANAVVRTRIMEPGEMAVPLRPVLLLAITDPKWVRAYVAEPDLVRVHPGTRASITVDGFPGRSYEGWVGFVSPVAEFTPKSVQTEELRTSLVFEVRVFVRDPQDDLRLGMPATVHLHAGEAAPENTAPSTSAVASEETSRRTW